MRILIFAAGSRGDIQPCAVLGKGLANAGYEVALAAPLGFEEFVQSFGIEYRPLRGDVRAIMASDEARTFMGSGGTNPVRTMRTMRNLIAPVVREMSGDLISAAEDADAMVCLGAFHAFGRAVADARGIPIVDVEPTPLLPTKAFPAPSWPVQRNLGGLHNRLSGRAMLRFLWSWYAPFIGELRQRLGLERWKSGDFLKSLTRTPMVGAYSSHLVPRPSDWPDSLVITGALGLEEEGDWRPPSALEAFLDQGEAPVFVGFGSMGGDDPERLSSTVIDALEGRGLRGILMTGWGGLKPGRISSNIMVIESCPHIWLFPRMAAVVHHGGAGTTAASVAAGVPTVIIPFILDQFFWGRRIWELGVGPNLWGRRSLALRRWEIRWSLP